MTKILSPPPRGEYVLDQKTRLGRRPVGVFPAQYPKEILWAFGLLPVEIWDPKVEPVKSGAHLQSYICSLAKNGLELILQGKCGDMEGFLFPHTCDSIQNLASVVHDYIGLARPCWFFYIPKAPYGPPAREYYRENLASFAARLAETFGPADEAKLAEAVEKGRRVSELLARLYEKNAAGELGLPALEFYRAVRAGEYLHPDDFIPLLENRLAEARPGRKSGPAVILSGVLPNPPELLEHIEKAGLRVGWDDFYSCGRRLLPAKTGEGLAPFDALTERFMSLPPCSTKGSPIKERVDHLLDIAGRSGASGVIFNIVKFCEAEFFDVPLLVEELSRRGIKSLVLETELNSGLSGQLKTRVEVFAELLHMEGA